MSPFSKNVCQYFNSFSFTIYFLQLINEHRTHIFKSLVYFLMFTLNISGWMRFAILSGLDPIRICFHLGQRWLPSPRSRQRRPRSKAKKGRGLTRKKGHIHSHRVTALCSLYGPRRSFHLGRQRRRPTRYVLDWIWDKMLQRMPIIYVYILLLQGMAALMPFKGQD